MIMTNHGRRIMVRVLLAIGCCLWILIKMSLSLSWCLWSMVHIFWFVVRVP